ncbi:hypothetical protein F4806DRAFT_310531 [Annulohypoxylon nitens]|nr:hypothetical protein F4806DRAFT_310531 [Annulohypoxylon nitens]
MSKVECALILGEQAASIIQSKYGRSEPLKPNSNCLSLSFVTTKAMANISHASVRKAKHDTYEKQLLKLKGEYANSSTCQNPTEWTFFVATETKSTVEFEADMQPKIFDGTEQETTDIKRNIWVKIAAIASNGPRDPLQSWFIKSPRVEVLDAGKILKHGETYEVAGNDAMTRPHVGAIDPVIKFLDHRIYRVITMAYAVADQMAKEKGIAESMKANHYRCWIIPLPGRTDDGGNVSTVTIVLRLDQEATNLPRRGDTFKVQLSGLQRKVHDPYPVDVEEGLVS